MFDVCVVGSANLDLVATTDRRPAPGETVIGTAYAEHPGGKGLNQAVAAARAGASVAFAGAVGDDAAGDALRAVLTGEGIDTRSVARCPVPTGRAVITVDGDAENSIIVVPGANGLVTVASVPPARVLLVQLEIPAAAVAAALQLAKAAGTTTILNPAPAIVRPHELPRDVDLVVVNAAEAAALGGPAALLGIGVSTVIVTQGSAGVDVVRAGWSWHQPPFAVDAVDTTGAGDAFCGVLAARLAVGDDLPTAVRAGAAAGALAATGRGAVPSLPSADAIAALVRG